MVPRAASVQHCLLSVIRDTLASYDTVIYLWEVLIDPLTPSVSHFYSLSALTFEPCHPLSCSQVPVESLEQVHRHPPPLQLWQKVAPLGLIFFGASFNLTILQVRSARLAAGEAAALRCAALRVAAQVRSGRDVGECTVGAACTLIWGSLLESQSILGHLRPPPASQGTLPLKLRLSRWRMHLLPSFSSGPA